MADDEDHEDEYDALLNLETGWAGGEEAQAIGDVEYSRLDPVALGGESETGLVKAAVHHRGAKKVLDACGGVADKVS